MIRRDNARSVTEHRRGICWCIGRAARETRNSRERGIVRATRGYARANDGAHTHTHTHTHTHKGKTEGTQRCVRPRNSHPCSLTPTQLIPKQLMPTQLTPTQSYTHAAHTYTTLHPRGTYLFARLNKRALTHTYTCIARNERAPTRKEKINETRGGRGRGSSRINWKREILSWIAQRWPSTAFVASTILFLTVINSLI